MYRQLVAETLNDEELAGIRVYVQQQRALGCNRFQAMIEADLGRCPHDGLRPAQQNQPTASSDKALWPRFGALAVLSKDLAHGDGRGRWAKMVYLRGMDAAEFD